MVFLFKASILGCRTLLRQNHRDASLPGLLGDAGRWKWRRWEVAVILPTSTRTLLSSGLMSALSLSTFSFLNSFSKIRAQFTSTTDELLRTRIDIDSHHPTMSFCDQKPGFFVKTPHHPESLNWHVIDGAPPGFTSNVQRKGPPHDTTPGRGVDLVTVNRHVMVFPKKKLVFFVYDSPYLSYPIIL